MSFEPDSPHVSAFEPSPNFGPRKRGLSADMLILHYTGMESAAAAIAWLTRPESSVSSHYLIDEAGAIFQMVAEEKRAWHAGVSCWCGEEDINSSSIGIEIQNPGLELGYPDYPPSQIAGVIKLCKDICQRNNIEPRRVLAHSDVAPGRKPDPGEKFPWDQLYENGVGVWVEAAPIEGDAAIGPGDGGAEVRALQNSLGQLGYRIEASGDFCLQTEQVVTAFQRHWRRERVDGRADISTINTLEALREKLAKPS